MPVLGISLKYFIGRAVDKTTVCVPKLLLKVLFLRVYRFFDLSKTYFALAYDTLNFVRS